MTVTLEVTPELKADEKSGRTSGKTHEPCTSRQPDPAVGNKARKLRAAMTKGAENRRQPL